MSLAKIKNIGIGLFTLGCMGAITAGAKIPAANETYPDTLTPFILFFSLAVVGVVMWHKSERQLVTDNLATRKDNVDANPLLVLKSKIANVQKIVASAQSAELLDLCNQLDDFQENVIIPFIECRKEVMDILGQQEGARVLLNFAYAERMLNRAWSAASDGHRPEAVSSLKESAAMFLQISSEL